MKFIEIIFIAVGLAMDAFAVSLAVGANGYAAKLRPAVRLAFHFGLFQFLMPVLGWYLGIQIEQYIRSVDHWIAFGLLSFVGIRMIITGWREEREVLEQDPTKSYTMVMLSVATSLDALAVGITLAMIHVEIWYPSAVIGIITACLSFLALKIGSRLSGAFGKWMEIAGGLIITLIGVKLLLEGLLL
ncbi:MAG: manganese efflux pump MntP family protein [Ignavibacteriales bacterium]|nr:manganese efflux pump MntP family protein [Ignavibacteriales bacterium]